MSKKDHGTTGPIHLTYGKSWLPDLGDIFTATEESGLKVNPDVNSGNPLGMGMGPVCIYNGSRLTSASTYLSKPPDNLTILPNSSIAKIIMGGTVAVGAQAVNGEKFFASKDIIVSGGALNTPQILMLSGLGPKDQLKKHHIPVLQNLPMLGKNLQDHCFSSAGIIMREDRISAPDGSVQSPSPMGWFKMQSVLDSQEFEDLAPRTKEFLRGRTIPTFEIATHTPPTFLTHTLTPGTTFLGAICLPMNPQSRGTVTLQSPDPTVAPAIDPEFLTHKFDRRVMIDGMRETMRILSAPVYAKKTIQKLGPENDSDEAIWEHVRKTTFSSWHMACTARMGTNSDSACVDSNFRVFGTEKLRVVDLSVCPFIPNNHPQSTAYIVGEIAAEKIIENYNLKGDSKANL